MTHQQKINFVSWNIMTNNKFILTTLRFTILIPILINYTKNLYFVEKTNWKIILILFSIECLLKKKNVTK